MTRMTLPAALLCTLLAVPGAASAADWFVAPVSAGGSPTGDGSRQRPFSDPWRAIAVAAPGDAIRIAEGTYFGQFDRSAWVIDRPRITILGGYDRQFTRRDPWKQPSVLAFYPDYEGSNENSLVFGRDDHQGLILDGLVIDGAGRNLYNSQPPFEMRRSMLMVTALVAFSAPDVVIRNCVIINSATGGVELKGEGSRFENNIVLNHLGQPMLSLRATSGRPMVIRGNTFAFADDDGDPPMGKGGEKGVAIRVGAPAQIENNVFVATGNAAINLFVRPGDVAIDGNVFWLTPRAAVAARVDGRDALITERNLADMEDLGFKSNRDNRVVDVGLTGLKAEWVDGVSRHALWSYATPPKTGLLALRAKYGLGEPVRAGSDDFGTVSPVVAPLDAAALRVDGPAGARPLAWTADLGPAVAAAPAALRYSRVEWTELLAGGASLEGRPVELLVAIGNERNGFVKNGITAEQHLGFDVFGGAAGSPDRLHVYAIRNGSVHRQWQDANKSTNAREAEDWYLLRGIARLANVLQKATIEVQSIVPSQPPLVAAPARPVGREWFVRAGASGGDGSREKPFRDPFQALERVAAGDVIRVAGGEYFGRLRSGSWKVPVRHLTLVGGYDAEFTSRDPWKHATRLVLAPDGDKSGHSGEFLGCSDNCEALVLDGFVFDGATLNSYFEASAGAGLNMRGAPIGSMVALQGSNITIRNCVFANPSGAAVSLSSTSGLFENNVVANASGTGVSIRAMGPGPWVIRRNTFLFAMDPTPRAGTGMSSAGSHLQVGGRAAFRIEGNIFGFADNTAIRATVARDKLVLDGNAFGANLFSHFSDASRVWLFDAVWERRLADAGLASARGNTITLPAALTLDKAYVDAVLPRFFEIKGRYTRDEWMRIASAVGSAAVPPVPPPATAAAPVEKPKEKPKEMSLDDLMRELEAMKRDSAKATTPVEAPKGPPYAPAYAWRAAIELAAAGDTTGPGARRVIK